jgi:hypothetical protein
MPNAFAAVMGGCSATGIVSCAWLQNFLKHYFSLNFVDRPTDRQQMGCQPTRPLQL